jgi:hypothetical protein
MAAIRLSAQLDEMNLMRSAPFVRGKIDKHTTPTMFINMNKPGTKISKIPLAPPIVGMFMPHLLIIQKYNSASTYNITYLTKNKAPAILL